jgi:hypothetical protein
MPPEFTPCLVQTRAADPYPQTHRDASPQAHAPAATPEQRPATGSAPAEFPGGSLRRIAALLRPAPTTRASHRDPLFERPDLIEDDYYRFRCQPGS